MKEFRFLDQKRQATGLSPEESARYAQLRDLVGPETAAPPRAGFDVNAAAARLRESLLPGGLRSQVPAPPPDPEPAPPPAPEPAPDAAALEAAFAEQPFAPLEAAPDPDPLFDPTSLDGEVRPQAWNPDAPGYDPNAPYDEAAWIAAGYDPTATYDWSASGYGPDGQPLPAEGALAGEPVAAQETAPADETAAWQAEAPQVTEPSADVAWATSDFGAEVPVEAPAEFQVDEPAGVQVEAQAAPYEPPADEQAGAAWSDQAVQGPELDLATEAEAAWAAAAEPALELEPVEIVEELPADEASGLLEGAEQPGGESAPEPALPFDPNAPFDHAKWFGRPAPEAAPAEEPRLEFALDQAAALVPEVPAPIEIVEDQPLDPLVGAPQDAPPAELGWGEPEPGTSVVDGSPALVDDGAPGTWTDVAAPPPETIGLSDVAAEPAPEPFRRSEAAGATGAPGPTGRAGSAAPAAWFDETTEPPRAPALAFGDYDGDGRGVPAGLAAMMVEPLPEAPLPGAEATELLDDGSATPYQPAPAQAAFGEYDELGPSAAPLDPGMAARLPFDPAAASAIEPGALPEGYDNGALAVDPATLPPAPLGGFDDPAAFGGEPSYGGPEGDALPGGTPLELGEPVQDWQPEQALEQGFELASNGSFGELERPALTPVPGWAASAAPPGALEGPHALDLGTPFELGPELASSEAAPLAEELPTLAGEDILEELAPAAAEPGPEAAGAPVEAFEPLPEPIAEPEPPAAAVAPYEGEIPPEIAAAFGDAPVETALPSPAAFAPTAEAGRPPPEPFDPAGSALFSEPPPAPGPTFGASEPEPIPEEDSLRPIEPEPEPIVEPEPLPEPGAAPQVWIEGSHRVVLHTVDGQVKRGLLVDAALDALDLTLRPQGPGLAETVPTEGVKAIFFMLAPGEKAAVPVGKKVRVTFRDGRQVAGYSPDYQEGTIGFFMIPADTRTNTGRIWVYQAAVRQVAVS